MTKTTSPHDLFWFGLFIPVNTLFQAVCFSLASLHLNLDSFVLTIVLVKAIYFLMVLFGIYFVKILWQAVADLPSQRVAWTYRLLGLASVGALLGVQAPDVYQFGRAEREIRRTMIAANKTFPSAPQAVVRTDHVRLENRDWVYESTMTQLQASQINREKFGVVLRQILSGTACAEALHRRLFQQNVRIRYVIRDRNGETVADESFGANNCPDAT